MPRLLNKILPGVIILALILAGGSALAQDTVNSRYFNVTIHGIPDRTALLKKLHADYFLRMDAAFSGSELKGKDIDALLGRTLDNIYLGVSDILDIHMYSFSVSVDIFPDRTALAAELQKYLNQRIDVPSFYFYDKNKIYISYNDMTLGMLAHEIAHAITSHYFVVQPSVRVQEILAGYAEFSVRKSVKELR